VGAQEDRLGGGSTEPAKEYTFFYRKRNGNNELGTGLFCIRESYQFKKFDFVVIGCHM
jgi:hypothetical protein